MTKDQASSCGVLPYGVSDILNVSLGDNERMGIMCLLLMIFWLLCFPSKV